MVFPSTTASRPLPKVGDACVPWLLLAGMFGLCLAGCSAQSVESAPAPMLPPRDVVIAQGQILPAGGIVQLAAAPGDVVARRLVEVGQQVSQGQPLLEMRSQGVSEAQQRTLHKRREEAAREQAAAIAAAERQLAAAELKIEHVRAQQASLDRKTKLLDLAQEQVAAAERVLNKLQAIAANSATSEFVGQLEIDRQRINLGEAELNYREQSEAQLQAQEDLSWALQAAEAERAAASDLLHAAKKSQALEVLDLELLAISAQDAAARIVAPIDGVILAVNASVGESSLPLPLVELANLEQLVCEVEINELDAGLVETGQAATIAARALGERQLAGRVKQKFSLVGRPQLRSPDPLARVDYRTVTALIELDQASTAIARNWLQLQVEVSIAISGPPQ